jgi:hypothetical protein
MALSIEYFSLTKVTVDYTTINIKKKKKSFKRRFKGINYRYNLYIRTIRRQNDFSRSNRLYYTLKTRYVVYIEYVFIHLNI